MENKEKIEENKSSSKILGDYSRFQWKKVSFEEVQLDIISRVRDFSFQEDSEVDFIPEVDSETIGQRIWQGSNLLSAYFMKHGTSWQGKDILELGAGVGVFASQWNRNDQNQIPSLLISKTTCNRVTITDCEPFVVEMIKENVKKNEPFLSEISVEVFDFCKENKNHEKKYDIVIAADVLYATAFVKPFLQSLNALLKPNGSLAVITHEKRFSLVVGGETEKEDTVLQHAMEVVRKENLFAIEEIDIGDDPNLCCFLLTRNKT